MLYNKLLSVMFMSLRAKPSLTWRSEAIPLPTVVNCII